MECKGTLKIFSSAHPQMSQIKYQIETRAHYQPQLSTVPPAITQNIETNDLT